MMRWIFILFVLSSCKTNSENKFAAPSEKMAETPLENSEGTSIHTDMPPKEMDEGENSQSQEVSIEKLNESAAAETKKLEESVKAGGNALSLANPTSLEESNLDRIINTQLNNSDLVFKGTTIEVNYTQSSPGPSGKVVPLTFVTFKVEEVIKGEYKKPTITVRSIGGWNADKTVFLSASDQPIFVVGDKDIIFLNKNGINTQPITLKGRLPIVNDMLYTTDSHKVEITDSGAVGIGEYIKNPSITEKKVGPNLKFILESQPTAPSKNDKGEGGKLPVQPGAGRGKHSNTKTFMQFIKTRPPQLGLINPDDQKSPVRSVPKTEVFNADEFLKPESPK